MSGKRQWPYVWQHVEGTEGEILTRGTCPLTGVPVLTWGWADREVYATRRQLKAMGLTRGRRNPQVACLHFGHRTERGRSLDHGFLYLISRAVPKKPATPEQLDLSALGLVARCTCSRCGGIQPYHLPKASHMCLECERDTDFYAHYAREHGHHWPATAAA